ncbi:hypothetical protein PybrP1_007908, partial [[Pythium] brassicae (nom. inval.)]
GCIPDTVNHTKFARDLYELVSKEPRSYTVPLLWDKKKQTIVSNESADILRTLNTGFRELVPSTVDLLPPALEKEIDAANAGVVESINSGSYKLVFVKSEEERLAALADLFTHMQAADELLSKSRYFVGSSITEADVRLFHALIRFDLQQREGDKFALKQYPNLVNVRNSVMLLRTLVIRCCGTHTLDWGCCVAAVPARPVPGPGSQGHRELGSPQGHVRQLQPVLRRPRADDRLRRAARPRDALCELSGAV